MYFNIADGVALLESSMTNAQAQISSTATAAEDHGLIINMISVVIKTEYMTVICNPQPPLEVYGQPINHVPNCLDTLVLLWLMVSVISPGERHLHGLLSSGVTRVSWKLFWGEIFAKLGGN